MASNLPPVPVGGMEGVEKDPGSSSTTVELVVRNRLPPTLTDVLSSAADFVEASRSAATRRAYRSDWRDFSTWCAASGFSPVPASAETVALYLTSLARAGLKTATIDRRAAAIAFAHRAKGHETPTSLELVRSVLKGIRNTLGRRPDKKTALTADLVVKVVRKIRPDLVGLRDRALLLVCFGGALRRSELVALDVEDLDRRRRGLVVLIGRSKTDQEGLGQTVAIPNGKLKVAEAVEAWRDAAEIASGPLFRGVDRGRVSARRLSDRQFARVLKARCAAVGLDPDRFSGHSPRSGFATSAGEADADLRKTARHLRHVKLETTLGYIQDSELFRGHAGKDFC